MRRRQSPPNLRADLARRIRAAADQWNDTILGGLVGWRQQAEELDAGLAVVVDGWQLSGFVRGRYESHVRVECDGSLTEVEPVKAGQTVVGWRAV